MEEEKALIPKSDHIERVDGDEEEVVIKEPMDHGHSEKMEVVEI